MSSSLNQSQQSTSQCFGWSANHGVCRPYMLAPASGYRLWQLVLTMWFKLLKGTKINTGKRKCPFFTSWQLKVLWCLLGVTFAWLTIAGQRTTRNLWMIVAMVTHSQQQHQWRWRHLVNVKWNQKVHRRRQPVISSAHHWASVQCGSRANIIGESLNRSTSR